MSGICGIIYKKGQPDNLKANKMKNILAEYKLDRIDEINDDKVSFFCGHQYITPEANYDISPIYDKATHTYFVGDVFLYNREELFERLEYKEDTSGIGDAYLAFLMYKKYNKDFVKYLRGAFSIVIFLKEKNSVLLFSDQCVKRYLAYYDCEEFFCFASTYKPILEIIDTKVKDSAIINAFRDMSAMNFFVDRETPFEGVYHLDNARIVTIDLTNTGSFSEEIYWEPLKNIKKLKLSDDECKALFLNTYEGLVKAQLRSAENTGVMLSGGLDSSSVAAFAAPFLKTENKNLYSYTSIPASDFKAEIDSYVVENETYLIEEQKKRHSNLVPRYINGDEGNCVSRVLDFEREYCNPIKPVINNLNIDKMGQKAAEDNCRILLSGANGNATVSYGNIASYLSLSWLQGHPVSTIREMFKYCKKNNLSRKKYLICWFKAFKSEKKSKTKGIQLTTFLKKELIEKYNFNNLIQDEKAKFGSEYYTTETQKNNFIYIPRQYIQKGYYYTYQGLKYGYLQLDPTLTVEMIELCLSLPNECYMKNGIERRMIKDYMKDLIPPAILDDKKGQGVQAADFNYRVNRDWDMIKDDVYDILSEPLLRKYLDKDKLDELVAKTKANEYSLDKRTVWDISQISSLGYFLRDYAS